MQTNTSWHL